MFLEKQDPFWNGVAEDIDRRFGKAARILAPLEFNACFDGTYPYHVSGNIDLRTLQALVIHKGDLRNIGPEVLDYVTKNCVPVFGNEVFVVFVHPADKDRPIIGEKHFPSFQDNYREALKQGFLPQWPLRSEFKEPTTVILMTTYNRPHFLARSLESISKVGAPILIVNDGSDEIHREAYREIYRRYPVRVIDLPDNRGLPNALNTGLGYWLSDPLVEWISYLQDDTEVRPDLLQVLAHFQDAEKQPILSGRNSVRHVAFAEELRDGWTILWKKMTAGTHLHAHRRYWEKIIPIPAPFFRSPARLPDFPKKGGAFEDWWITQWSPHSIVKQGGAVCIVSGLVRTFVFDPADSTWGGEALQDQPLRSALPREETP